MKRFLLVCLFLATLSLGVAKSRSESVLPVGFSFAHDTGARDSVAGLALGLPVGDFETVIGIDVGLLANHVHRWMIGLQATMGVNELEQGAFAWQMAGMANIAEDSLGIQTAIGFNRCRDSLSGMQLGSANFVNDLRHGLQIGVYNCSRDFTFPPRLMHGIQCGVVNQTVDLSGAQIGIWNRAREFHGLQIGLVNTAESLRGIQIGLANFSLECTHPFLPLVRVAF